MKLYNTYTSEILTTAIVCLSIAICGFTATPDHAVLGKLATFCAGIFSIAVMATQLKYLAASPVVVEPEYKKLPL